MAIDPGASGGIVVANFSEPTPSVQVKLNMPEVDQIAASMYRMAREHMVSMVVIEKQTGCAGYAVSAPAMFKFGVMYGAAITGAKAISSNQICSVMYITPQTWQKAMNVGKSGVARAPKGATQEEKNRIRDANASIRANWKRVLADKAEEEFPGVGVTLKNADALLIALFGFKFLSNSGANSKFRSPL